MPADLSNEEARAEVVMCYHPANFSEAEFLERLATLESAVRATLLASLIEKVEGTTDQRHDAALDVSYSVRASGYLGSNTESKIRAALAENDRRVLTLLRTEAENG